MDRDDSIEMLVQIRDILTEIRRISLWTLMVLFIALVMFSGHLVALW
jgi:hypothetical protein